MTHLGRILAAWLAALMLCLCPGTAIGEAAEGLTAYSDLEQISKYGNVRLVTDHLIVLEDLEAAGIEPGDTVRVTFLDRVMEMPLDFDFSDVKSGAVLLRIKDDSVSLAINLGDFASETIADKTVDEDGSVLWRYKDGIEGPVAFHIELIRKGDHRGEGEAIRLRYTDERADYPNLSDAAFANFRMVATTGMGEGVLYRSSSPIDPKHKRNIFADDAMRMAGVKTIMNLADSREIAEGYGGYGESYYSTTDRIELCMGISFNTQEAGDKLAEGLRFFGAHEGPYAVHCQEGKDRTGMVAALLECFMGSTYDEVRKDYMETFCNYYGIVPGDSAYDKIAENNIDISLRKLLETDDLSGANLAKASEAYFRRIGLKDADIERLRLNLSRQYPVSGNIP